MDADRSVGIGNGEYGHLLGVWGTAVGSLTGAARSALLGAIDALAHDAEGATTAPDPAFEVRISRYPAEIGGSAGDWVGLFVGFSAAPDVEEPDLNWDDGLVLGSARWPATVMDDRANEIAAGFDALLRARLGVEATAAGPERVAELVAVHSRALFAVHSFVGEDSGPCEEGLLESVEAAELAAAIAGETGLQAVGLPACCGDPDSSEGCYTYDATISYSMDLLIALDKMRHYNAAFAGAKHVVDTAIGAVQGVSAFRRPSVAATLVAENVRQLTALLDLHSSLTAEIGKTVVNATSALEVLGARPTKAAPAWYDQRMLSVRLDDWARLEQRLRDARDNRLALLDALEKEQAAHAKSREGVLATGIAVLGAALGLGFIAEALAALFPASLPSPTLQAMFKLAFTASTVLGLMLGRLVGRAIDHLGRRHHAHRAPDDQLEGTAPLLTRPVPRAIVQAAVAAALPVALVLATVPAMTMRIGTLISPHETGVLALESVVDNVEPGQAELGLWASDAAVSRYRDDLREWALTGLPVIERVYQDDPVATVFVRFESGKMEPFGYAVLRLEKTTDSATGKGARPPCWRITSVRGFGVVAE